MGQCVIQTGSKRICPEAQMRFAMALYLAIERDSHLHRRHLAELFWPQFTEARARHSLRHLAYVLRSIGFPLSDVSNHIGLSARDVWLDYEGAMATSPVSPATLRGFLPGYSPTFSSPFTEWLDRTRNSIHCRLRLALLTDLTMFKRRGQWAEMAETASRCLTFDPLNEEATLALAEATALAGNKLQAVAILDRYSCELGTAPNEIRLPATVLRRRITERLPKAYVTESESFLAGREATLAMLGTHLRSARSGRGTGCYIWGTAGIGKSRIGLELARIAAIEGVRVQRMACQRSDPRRPLSVFCDIAPALLDLPGALGCAPRSRQYLTRLIQPPESDSSFLTALQNEAAEAPFIYAALRQSILDLIDAICEETTLLLVIDDVQWIDSHSAELLRGLIERSSHRRLMVLLTARNLPPPDTGLSGLLQGLQIHHLQPLSQSESVRLFGTLTAASDRVLSAEVAAHYAALAEGNPYFLRELAAHWVLTGLTRPPPETIIAALDERLCRLSATSLRVLQACALLGKNSTLDRLERILDIRHIDLLDCLDALDSESVLACDAGRVLPKHELLSQAAVAKLSVNATRFLHARIGKVLKTDLATDAGGSLLWDTAEHFTLAGDVDAAVRLMMRCADHALKLGSLKEAIEIWERAHNLHTSNEVLGARVRRGLVLSLRRASAWSRILAIGSDGPTTPAGLGAPNNQHDRSELAIFEARWRVRRNTAQLLQDALTCLRCDDAPSAHRAEAAVWALIVSHNVPHAQAANEAYAILRTLPRHEAEDRHRVAADLVYQTAFGDLYAGAQAGQKLVDISRPSRDDPGVPRALRLAAIPLLYLGEFGSARKLLDEALALAERDELTEEAVTAAGIIARSYFECGDLSAAKEWMARSEDLSGLAPETVHVECDPPVMRAQIALLEGHLTDDALLKFSDCARWAEVQSFRFRSIVYGVAALSRLGIGEQFDESQAFEKAFNCASVAGGQDFAAYARCAMQSRLGERNATAALRQYVANERRERSPLPPYLARALC
jgi:tetratricopeptide (TPR) repeat protein